MVYAMRSKLRGAVDDMVTNGLTNSIKVPNKITYVKNDVFLPYCATC